MICQIQTPNNATILCESKYLYIVDGCKVWNAIITTQAFMYNYTHTYNAYVHTYVQSMLYKTYSCKGFKDLNSFFAIVFGLMNGAISRLKNTWEVCTHVLVSFIMSCD